MKRIITIFAVLMLTAGVFAQSPQKMSYQAVIRNSSNILDSNHAVGMRISMLQGSASGTAVYIETQSPTTNAVGLVSIEIGGGTVVSGNFSNINWGNGPYFTKTETDPAGGTNYSITGTSQLLSVPYALHAKTAAKVVGDAGSHYIGEPYGGGVIFHLWQDSTGVEHGLIVAITDQSTAYRAWNNHIFQPSYWPVYSSWDGLTNSNAINLSCGNSPNVAQMCLDLVSGGQSDWYLPAIDELNLIGLNRFAVNRALMNISGATLLPTNGDYLKGDYLSSTLDPSYTTNVGLRPFVYCFRTNYVSPPRDSPYSTGNDYFYVRAIRNF